MSELYSAMSAIFVMDDVEPASHRGLPRTPGEVKVDAQSVIDQGQECKYLRCALQGTRHLIQQILENPPELITVAFYEGLRGIERSLGKGLDITLELHQQLERAAILIDDVIKVVRELRDMVLSNPDRQAQAAIERQEGPIQYLDETVQGILQCYKANFTATRDKIRAAERGKKQKAQGNSEHDERMS